MFTQHGSYMPPRTVSALLPSSSLPPDTTGLPASQAASLQAHPQLAEAGARVWGWTAGLLVGISHMFAVLFQERPQPLLDSLETFANISLP